MAAFNQQVLAYDYYLKQPYDFSLHGEFQKALSLVGDWSEISLVCETDREYVAFFWETSA
jgi:hypothetical protein